MQPIWGRPRWRLGRRATLARRCCPVKGSRPATGNARRARFERLERRDLLATLGDLVWLDANDDGLQQPAETGVSGAVVELLSDSGQSLGVAITGDDGLYAFADVAPGDYQLDVRLPVGFDFTLPGAGPNDGLDSDIDPTTGVSAVFSIAADDSTRDAGLTGAAPGFGFALAGGGAGADRGQAVAVDAAGNIFVTGSFSGESNFAFGSIPRNLTSEGDEDIFVAKYSAAGALVWVRGFGGEDAHGEGLGIAVGPSGDIYLTGQFTGSVDFDPSADGTEELTATDANVFVARLAGTGGLVWARQAGDGGGDSGGAAVGFDLAVDADGNVFVTGQFSGSVDFDPGEGVLTVDAGDSNDAFFWKLTESGELGWARASVGDSSTNAGKSIALASNGDLLAAGQFGGATTFGSVALESHGGDDIFVTRLDATGQFVWAAGLGGGGADTLGGLDIDPWGNIVIAGGFEQTVDLDPGDDQYLLTAVGAEDAFVTKLSPAGGLIWARAFAGAGAERAVDVAVDENGNVYSTGPFDGGVDFDPGFATDVLTSVGGSDVFVAKLDGLGNHVLARSVGGEGSDESSAIAVDAFGQPTITGWFGTEPAKLADFDPGPGQFLLESAGSDDFFVASLKMTLPGNSAPAMEPGAVFIATDEDTTLTVGLAEIVNNGPGTTIIVDADASDPLGGVAVIQASGHGVFFYSLDGSTFNPLGAVSTQQSLLLPPDAFLRYVPDGMNGEAAELIFRAWDGSVGDAGQKVDTGAVGGDSPFSVLADMLTFDVADVNDSPSLQPVMPTATTTEDTPLEFTVANLSDGELAATVIDDVDVNDPVGGIAITQFMGFGTLAYSLNGDDYTDVGSVSESSALLLPADAQLRYSPNRIHGHDVVISYRAWDTSDGLAGEYVNSTTAGAATPFSELIDTLLIDVTDVNDAPELLAGSPTRATSEDDPLVIPLGSFINAGLEQTLIGDVDTGAQIGGIALIASGGRGDWEYAFDGELFKPVGSVSDSSALLLPASTTLRYSPDTANGETAFVRFRAWDATQGTEGDRNSVGVPGGTTAFSSNLDTLWINVSDLNDAPAAIVLDSTSIQENRVAGVVGNVSVVDPDDGDSHVLSVSDARFEVVAGVLKLKAGQVLDHESNGQVSLSITAVDTGQLEHTESFVIDVLDINEPPTRVEVSNDRVAENDPGAVVGDLSVSDPDEGDTHTFGISDARFEVVGTRLRLKDGVSLDHEADHPLSIIVTAFDSGDLPRTETLVIQVDDRNEAPTALSVSGNSVEENKAGAIVGSVSVTDPDANEQFSFELSDDRFEVSGGQLKLKPGASLDFESEPSVSLQLTATDSGSPGLSVTLPLVVTVVDVNEAPSGLSLEPAAIDENVAGGIIGSLVVEDPESDDEHTYSVSDDRFEVAGGQLRLKSGVALNHEAEATVDVDVTVTDNGEPPRQATHRLTVQVGDVNEAPELAGALADQNGMSNHPLVFAVAANTFMDVDDGDQLVYAASLVDGSALPDWLSFDSSTRTFSGVPSIYDPGPYHVRVTATDQGNLSVDDTFMIEVQASPAPWQNPAHPMDVNNDGRVSPVDILILINFINTHPGNAALPTAPLAPPPFYDVNGDNLVTPADILVIVNFANGGGSGEGESGNTTARVALYAVAGRNVHATQSAIDLGGRSPTTRMDSSPDRDPPSTSIIGSTVVLRSASLRSSASQTAHAQREHATATSRRRVWEELSVDAASDWWLARLAGT